MFLIRLLIGQIGIRSLALKSETVSRGFWRVELEQVCHHYGITRPIRLLKNNGVKIPMTSGCRRPLIFLPDAAEQWSRERCRVVLLHELAHVKRLDCLTQFMGQLVRALYWFHPFVWIVYRQFIADQEKACDEMVIAGGIRPTRYADHLLDLSRVLFRNLDLRSAVAVTMARPSRLEGRLLAILNTRKIGKEISMRKKALIIATIIMTIIGLATLYPFGTVNTADDDTESEEVKKEQKIIKLSDKNCLKWIGENGKQVICIIKDGSSGEKIIKIINPGDDDNGELEKLIESCDMEEKGKKKICMIKSGKGISDEKLNILVETDGIISGALEDCLIELKELDVEIEGDVSGEEVKKCIIKLKDPDSGEYKVISIPGGKFDEEKCKVLEQLETSEIDMSLVSEEIEKVLEKMELEIESIEEGDLTLEGNAETIREKAELLKEKLRELGINSHDLKHKFIIDSTSIHEKAVDTLKHLELDEILSDRDGGAIAIAMCGGDGPFSGMKTVISTTFGKEPGGKQILSIESALDDLERNVPDGVTLDMDFTESGLRVELSAEEELDEFGKDLYDREVQQFIRKLKQNLEDTNSRIKIKQIMAERDGSDSDKNMKIIIKKHKDNTDQ